MDTVVQLTSGTPFLTFGGMETYLIFQRDFELREFAAFEVLDAEEELANLEEHFLRPTFDAAAQNGLGLLCDCFVWRAAPDFVSKLGYSADELATINRKAVDWMRDSASRWQAESSEECPILLGGELGPRGDGYALSGSQVVTSKAAAEYHGPQIRALAAAQVDAVFAYTMTSRSEAVGIVHSARENGLPIVVSATVETDGRLPDGSALGDFVEAVDNETDGYPLLYMVNCAHPTHLEPTLTAARERDQSWLGRFKGLRANASTKSHAELDNSTSLDAGDPDDLAARMASLQQAFDLTVIGGCCGTDATHVRAIASACSQK